jgi:hypothetical protein
MCLDDGSGATVRSERSEMSGCGLTTGVGMVGAAVVRSDHADTKCA